jgi:sigma-B regulation protein RsbU (phosphoserine phosphatase)
MQLLFVNPSNRTLPEALTGAGSDCGWTVSRASNYHQALETAGHETVDAAIVPAPPPGSVNEFREFDNLLRILDSRRIATLILSDSASPAVEDSRSLLETVRTDISAAELRGRLAMIARYHGLVKRLEQELNNMERLSKRLNLHFRDIDQEMRLAGRLQRDFLPNTREPIGNLRFASVFRPASWVSGDMFDIFRIDETHSGIYIADAVGHGMAAGLLTMFIKRAIVPKRIDASGYSVLSPSEIIAALNDALAEQSLPQCQFVTACYALINHQTLDFQFARGGHPYPILITRDGIVSEVKTPGGLLGLFKGEEFAAHHSTLRTGDKVIFYTDGIELAFASDDPLGQSMPTHMRFFEQHASMPINDLMACMERHLDGQNGSLHPADDVSLIGLEVI